MISDSDPPGARDLGEPSISDSDSDSNSKKPGILGGPGQQVPLWDLALSFLKLGTIAFGGPAAHIALMEQEFVHRRRWLSREEFLDLLGAANLIPGPSSTEMAIYIGQRQRGWLGLIVAGCSFIIPAAILVGAIAVAYVRYGALPQVNGILYAMKPVVIAVVAHAFWKLARTALKTAWLGLVGLASAVLFFFQINIIVILMAAGASALLPTLRGRLRSVSSVSQAISLKGIRWFKWLFLLPVAGAGAAPIHLWAVFRVFLKIGSVLFGSGYVLLALLRSDLVLRLHWLTEKQLLDAVAVGQVTPGPVFTTATFIGYVVGGIPGAITATLAIFLPGFLLVAASGPLIPRLRRSPVAGAVLDGVIVGSLALMGVATWQLARAALVDPLTIVLACVSGVLLFAFRVNPAWLILSAALIGLVQR